MRVRPLLIVVLALLALAASGCGGGQEVAPTAEDVQGTVETGADETATETDGATTGETETEAETETGDEADDNGGGRGNAEAGRAIYDANGCGGCHVLGAAGSSGNVGPNLDESKPSFEEAVTQIANGGGGMPAYKDQLRETEINNVAAFVSENAGD